MSRFKPAVDSPHSKPWIERIGKIVLNFSALELETLLWLVQLSEQPDRMSSFTEMPFANRAKQVMQALDARSIGPKWRKASLRAWNDSLKLAKIRNHLAHNPLMFAWRGPAQVGEPDIIGIPNLRVRGTSHPLWTLSKADVDKSINDMLLTATKLGALRSEWCSARDNGLAPPVPTTAERTTSLARIVSGAVKWLISNLRLQRPTLRAAAEPPSRWAEVVRDARRHPKKPFMPPTT